MLRSKVLARARQRAGIEIISGDQDPAGLLALTKLMYPDSDISKPEYPVWQYEANPAGHAIARLAKAGQSIVGQYTVIPMDFNIGRSRLQGSLSLNTMTHPDHRAKGIFMLLAEEVYASCPPAGVKFTIGFPNPNSYSGFVRHLNFKDIGELPLWILPLNISALAKSISRFPAWITPSLGTAQAFWDMYRKMRITFRGSPVLRVEEIAAFDSSFDRLSEQCGADGRCMVARTQRYLRWRFQDHPTRRYRTWGVRLEDELQGYLVTRITDVDGLRCGMLVDLLVRNTLNGAKAARALVAHATGVLQSEGAALAGCLMPQMTPGASALAAQGFWRCPRRFLPQPFPVIVRWHGPEAAPHEFYSLNNWYLTMGDYDAV